MVDRLQLKRIAAAVGAPLTDADLSDPLSLVRPNKRGRIAVAKAEKWLGPQLKSLDPPKKQLSPDEKVVQTITVDLSGCVYGHKLSLLACDVSIFSERECVWSQARLDGRAGARVLPAGAAAAAA